MRSNLANMKCLDLFISSQDEQEYNAIKPLLTRSESIQLPIMSFDLYIDYFSDEMEKLNRENDINTIKEFASKFQWTNNLDNIFKGETFETIVLTNIKQEILWVNDGFKKMTGFNKNFALKKKPSFLQGKDTCKRTSARIREKILQNKPFKEIVLNYREDKTAYECEIKGFPLSYKNTTHYIALERVF
ncbi:PAS domain-containing protein [Polaribacter sp. PL03]|uniref:PAS domain-containing protein n=1 Tax=Polaribacter sp. PL03 TaxID=3088353 RepID=UPI0029D0C31B|nr:PAS domain-containing protein [Polaribacter sp. PL03]MDX6747593.1 PAS domain-containing protein [Polaribacter sp. PL03]